MSTTSFPNGRRCCETTFQECRFNFGVCAQKRFDNVLFFDTESQGREERHKSSSANAFLNPHWAYELPLIHLIMSYLWTVAVDPSTNDGFHASSGLVTYNKCVTYKVLSLSLFLLYMLFGYAFSVLFLL